LKTQQDRYQLKLLLHQIPCERTKHAKEKTEILRQSFAVADSYRKKLRALEAKSEMGLDVLKVYDMTTSYKSESFLIESRSSRRRR
jgi:hypothetical protein